MPLPLLISKTSKDCLCVVGSETGHLLQCIRDHLMNIFPQLVPPESYVNVHCILSNVFLLSRCPLPAALRISK